MLKNYFKIAFRSLVNNKGYSIINIGGLAAGITVALLIALWVYDEISFDKKFDHHNRIARVIQNVTNNGEVQTWNNVPFPLAEELRKNYGSDFKHIAMAVGWSDHLLTINNKKLKSNGLFFEKEMPEMFSLKMLSGNQKGLYEPASILLSASAAKAYFGDGDAINKIIKIDENPIVKVTGVYEDFPKNSFLADVKFISTWDFYYSINNGFKEMENPWRPNFTSLFVELNENADIKAVSARIRDAKLKKVNTMLAQKKPALFLQPMNDWHLYAEFKNGVNVGGAIQNVWMFGIIGVFVLLLACINFMNLSTARSEKRAKEVGIRKTVGSLRVQLIMQFFSESLLTVLFAFLFSLLMVQLSLPLFNKIANKEVSILWNSPVFWLASLCFIILTAVVSGSYPAFYLSSFKPVKVLKGTFKAGRFAALPRRILVVLQFTVSVTLIIGTIVVYKQIEFAKNRPVGYTRNGLINTFTMNNKVHDHFDVVRNELIQNGAIVSMAESISPTTGTWNSTSGLSWRGKDPNLSTDLVAIDISHDFGKTIDWQFKEGRDFSRDFATDSSGMIINEAAAKFMGFQNAVGERILWWDKPYTVIGVVKNMIMNSPYDEPRPTVFALLNEPANVVLLKLNPAATAKQSIAKIETAFNKINPDQPFEYQFVDEDYARKFDNEERVSKLSGFFAVLAIAISCLGLLGLTSFVAEQRKKEIGVRKVLGASVLNVWHLLSKDFLLLVMIAFLIAVPLSYYFMHNWLQNYNYRTEISWWIFIAAGIGSLLITLLTVSFQSIKAAIANPVKSLRTE
ncbi:MAG: ABC transporter permease [Agriterribacter sp.]